jgi:very-short-patch-repair endonuclease
MLPIGIDGNSRNDKFDYDMNKQMKLQDLGVRLIRFFDVEVNKNMAGVLSALENKIDEIVSTSPPDFLQRGSINTKTQIKTGEEMF